MILSTGWSVTYLGHNVDRRLLIGYNQVKDKQQGFFHVFQLAGNLTERASIVIVDISNFTAVRYFSRIEMKRNRIQTKVLPVGATLQVDDNTIKASSIHRTVVDTLLNVNKCPS